MPKDGRLTRITKGLRATAPVQLRVIDCRPDLYERLQRSWSRRGRTGRRFAALLLGGGIVVLTAFVAIAWRA